MYSGVYYSALEIRESSIVHHKVIIIHHYISRFYEAKS